MTLAISELVDYSTFSPPGPDGELLMDLSSRRITGARVPLEWVARSWLQPRGGNPAARGRGTDIMNLENATLGPHDKDRWRQALIAEALEVEYVTACSVAASVVNRTIIIDADVTLIDGKTYSLAVRMSEASKVVTFGGVS